MRIVNKLDHVPKNFTRIFGQYIKETEKAIYFSWDGVIKHLPKSKMIMLINGIKPTYFIQNWVLNYCR